MFDAAPYQRAFHWVRCAYLDGPDTLALTAERIHLACGVEAAVCGEVLEALARARFLIRAADGSYMRRATAPPAEPRYQPPCSSAARLR